jgi:hypothetical protein
LYFCDSEIKEVTVSWTFIPDGEARNACKIFVWEPTGRRLLERLSRRWEDNIKIDIRKYVLRMERYLTCTSLIRLHGI